jgi:ABC-type multidrug transport system fused ATPase/permease subunit
VLKDLQDFFLLLTDSQKYKLAMLQLAMIVSALLETLVVISIGPFMAFASNPSLINTNSISSYIYSYLNFTETNSFLILIGVAVLVLMIFSAYISIQTTRTMSTFGGEIGAELSNRMYRYYIFQPLSFHLKTNTSSIASRLTLEANRMTHSVIIQFLYLNARIILIASMALTIFFTVPSVALLGTLFFAISYFGLYRFASNRLERNGKITSDESEIRFRAINESFGGIKDVLLKGLQGNFMKTYEKSTTNYFNAWSSSQILTLLPRYAMELAAFGSMITAILFLLLTFDNNLQHVLPIISVFGLASLKMLPAFQQVYYSFSTIKSNINSFFTVREALNSIHLESPISSDRHKELLFKKSIEFKNVSFKYKDNEPLILDDISFKIKPSKSIGIVGSSGSGKSTVINILVGLLFPTDGNISIDDHTLDKDHLRSWQSKIGLVSQNIFLLDSSIKDNIAFGVEDENIDIKSLNKAIKMAQLEDLVNSLPDGVNTLVGERGSNLSGGQLQRVGIARALYTNPDIIVFDEATSNLDTISEKQIMLTINELARSKTIIMIAHRLSTVRNCEVIYLFDKGQIIDSGTYESLQKSNKLFSDMI